LVPGFARRETKIHLDPRLPEREREEARARIVDADDVDGASGLALCRNRI
jgi:hypothetical protein